MSGLLMEDVDAVIKVIVVGNGAVGKTSMINRFCNGVFGDQYKKTLGVDFSEKRDYHVESIDEVMTMHVWDTAGQEEYDAVTAQYYRGADACVLAFSTTDDKSFKDLRKWKAKVEDHCPNLPMVIMQNKIDLLATAAVTKEEVEALAGELKLKLYRTSVKDNTNVSEVFDGLAELYHKNKNARPTVAASTTTGIAKEEEKTVDLKPRPRAEKKKSWFSGC